MPNRTFADAAGLAAELQAASSRIVPALAVALRHEGALLQARIRANASGRPGPNVITGAYRDSWRTVSDRVPGGARVTVGTTAPQGRRLEFGFMNMTDSLGRLFHQPPYPHVQPAVETIRTTLPEQLLKAIREAL